MGGLGYRFGLRAGAYPNEHSIAAARLAAAAAKHSPRRAIAAAARAYCVAHPTAASTCGERRPGNSASSGADARSAAAYGASHGCSFSGS
jgi:hypothetical protein